MKKKTSTPKNNAERENEKKWQSVASKNVGRLDMVIAFDTTGSMAAYIDDVRRQVADLVPELFRKNEDLRLGIVAFGDYCDMRGRHDFGPAYQCQPLTTNANDLVRFVLESQNTSGGDGDEFYELVIKKVVEETAWREDSTRVLLLISDAAPHPLGYSFGDVVKDNKIDWREEARKAAAQQIKIDTVTITGLAWYKELAQLTGGVCVPFSSSNHTAQFIKADLYARGSHAARAEFDQMMCKEENEEMRNVLCSLKKTRDEED